LFNKDTAIWGEKCTVRGKIKKKPRGESSKIFEAGTGSAKRVKVRYRVAMKEACDLSGKRKKMRKKSQ